MGTTPFNERYDTTRREIESARKDLRGEGWSRLFSALLKLRKLGDEKLGCGIGIPFAKWFWASRPKRFSICLGFARLVSN